MTVLTAKLERWAAWAPGIESEQQWQQWAVSDMTLSLEGEPCVKFLPAMFRRRLTRLSKMALSVAYRCLPEAAPVHTVFCSRHGDFNMTRGLLDELVKGELISPTGFSMSVHNTASGLYTIARNDKTPSTAIASGQDSFESGFLEAASLLQNQRAGRVLLVVCDEPVPTPFTETYQEIMWPHALAFLLAPTTGCEPSLSLNIDRTACSTEQSTVAPHALSLLRCLLKQESDLRLPGKRFSWYWKVQY